MTWDRVENFWYMQSFLVKRQDEANPLPVWLGCACEQFVRLRTNYGMYAFSTDKATDIVWVGIWFWPPNAHIEWKSAGV